MSRERKTALGLFALTLLSMFWAGSRNLGVNPAESLSALWQGYSFALPLMAILATHELGHYVTARLHGEHPSPPYFLPMPVLLFGTLGAVIEVTDTPRPRNALFDIGASGPWCGLLVALPVLIYGIATSDVQVINPELMSEGHSLLYMGLLYAIKGPIPAGHDIVLTPTALAGWAGLLVTMINLVPIGQLDGGHVGYALFGERQDQYSLWARRALLLIAIGLSGGSLIVAAAAGAEGNALWSPAMAGINWLLWWGVLMVMAHLTGDKHPPTEPSELSPLRRVLAWLTLLLFVALFMPTWLKMG